MAKKNYLKQKTDKEIDAEKHQKLLTRLSVAKAYEAEERKAWKEVLKVLDFKRDVLTGSDTVTKKIKYPLLWSAYDNYLSNLTSTPPQTVIEAEGKEDMVKKIFWRGVLEYRKRKIRLEDLKEEFVQSLIATGKAVYKVGRIVETKKEIQVVADPDTGMKIEKEVEAVIRNESYVDCIDPTKVWISPETKYKGPVLGEECPYIIEEMIKTPEYIETRFGVKPKDKELEVIDPEKEGVMSDKQDSYEKVPTESQDDLKRVRMYAYYGEWEGKQNQEVLFTTKRILRFRDFPYEWGNKKPYIYVLNFKKFFKAKARGSLDAVLDLDLEYNEHMNRLRTILRRMASPKWAKQKGTQVDEEALLDPDVGLVVEESQPQSFRPVEGPKIDPALFDKATSVEQLFQLLTGIVYGSAAIKQAGTATGQGIVEKGADVKIGRISRLIERAQEELDIMLLQLEQQYAPQEGTDIRITGADIIRMLQDKKFLYGEKVRLYEEQQMMLQTGQAHEMNGYVMSGPEHTPESQVIGRLITEPPVDEYERFEISSDGKSVSTTYTSDDIEGEFELTVVSQSSNRSNRAVEAQQIINALTETRPGEENLRRELWRRLFINYSWDEIIDAVESIVPDMGGQTPGGAPVGNAVTENGINSSINGQAQQTT